MQLVSCLQFELTSILFAAQSFGECRKSLFPRQLLVNHPVAEFLLQRGQQLLVLRRHLLTRDGPNQERFDLAFREQLPVLLQLPEIVLTACLARFVLDGVNPALLVGSGFVVMPWTQ
ncbi:hypothetical protein AB0L97_13250 [Nocardia sp. NPDC051911]|uniref:hypothetical protein n=1 Tax=Nocardia sp. NPDC051911 TaxID=3154648 RepID=UPI00343E4696